MDTELNHYGVKGMKWGVTKGGLYSKSKPPKNAMDGDGLHSKSKQPKKPTIKSKKSLKKKATKGAKAVVTALQVVGTAYALDLAYTGGAVTRTAAKAVKSTLNKVGDQMFNYAVLDKDGKVLRRYN